MDGKPTEKGGEHLSVHTPFWASSTPALRQEGVKRTV